MINEPNITIDLTYLHTVTGGDRQFEKMLLEGAVEDIQLKIDDLQKAWDREDAPTICSNAHSLKSLTAIAGLPQIEHWGDNIFLLVRSQHFLELGFSESPAINDTI